MKAIKEQRYKAIKSLIGSNGIQGLRDVFTIMPMSTVREDMKINYNTLRRRVNNGELLTVGDIISLSDLFEVDPLEVFRLVINDINATQKSRKK